MTDLPPPPPQESGEPPAPGWWKASDDNWYPPELHPDYVVPTEPAVFAPPPQPGPPVSFLPPLQPTRPVPFVDSRPADSKSTSRWLWAAAICAVVAVAAGGALLARSSKDSDTATAPATATVSAATAPAATESAEPAATEAGDEEPATAADPAAPGREFAEGCSYIGLDSFDDIQVEIRFVNTIDSPGDLSVTYALSDSAGVRFLTSMVFVEAAQPQERFWLDEDTLEGRPSSVSGDDITCEVLELEAFSFGEAPNVAAGTSCSFGSLDFADDIQLEYSAANPFPETTDLALTIALRGADGVRFATTTAFVELVGAGETVRQQHDSFAGFPDWVPPTDFSCDIVDIEDFG